MKPSMLFAVIMLTAIVLISSFGLQLIPVAPIQVPSGMEGHVLYLCPAASSTWDSVASALRPMVRYIMIGYTFAAIILTFVWGWALYQALLSDKFERPKFSNPWKFTKFLFWAGIILLLAASTPNHFKRVHVVGESGDFILCDHTTPGAQWKDAKSVIR